LLFIRYAARNRNQDTRATKIHTCCQLLRYYKSVAKNKTVKANINGRGRENVDFPPPAPHKNGERIVACCFI